MSLGTRLRDLRRANKLTQKEVARRLEIDNTTISKWEADVYEPNADTLDKLATLYDTSVDQLLGRVPSLEKAQEDRFNQRSQRNGAGRAFFGGADQYTDEELEIADAAAKAAVEAYRKGRAKAQKDEK